MPPPTAAGSTPPFDPRSITRPDPVLMRYYLLGAILTGPGAIVMLPLLYFRYLTLRYRFDDDGVWIGSGLLFKREVNLSYRRIQDIHLTRGILQRYFGLATLSVQTAAGSSTPEGTIEGVLEAEALRDFLYTRMRGARGLDHADAVGAGRPGEVSPSHDALILLQEIRDALKQSPTGAGGRP